tara:strand:- start:794 stop:1726 length:933 start_codon:yes stop_codon:yes gene_type:complete
MLKIYYWANNLKKNSGEGILALNFLSLLKIRYKNCKLIKLNNFKHKDTFFYNYFLPFVGALKLWHHHLKGRSICYINYLPIWNFLLFLILPKKTILGPITGTNIKKNYFYRLLKYFGIFFLKKRNKVLFSHSQFLNYFKYKKNYYFNFILYNFSFKKKFFSKKYDFIIYFKKNNNKGNNFLIKIISRLSKKFKIVVIGDKIPSNFINKNIFNYQNLNRKKALIFISQSKHSIISKENTLSFFAIDCVACQLNIFHNINDKLESSIKTNLFTPIKFNNVEYSLRKINKKISSKDSDKYFRFKTKNFLYYLD